MKLTYLNHYSAKFQKGDLVVLGTNNIVTYQELVNNLRMNNDSSPKFLLTDDGDNELKLNRYLNFVGDLLFINNDEVIKTFLKFFSNHLSSATLNTLNQLELQLVNQFQQVLYDDDISLSVQPLFSIAKLLKLVDISFDTTFEDNYYAVIEVLVKMQVQIDNNVTLIFVNLHQILSLEELSQLNHLCKVNEISMILIEFDEINNYTNYVSDSYHYIDTDFVYWEK